MKNNLFVCVIAIGISFLAACHHEEEPTINKPTMGFDENGASYAKFSVSKTKQVRFSRGNLQYQASTGLWRFAEKQYDHIGGDNANMSETYSGWIDLFGWGTSGWQSGAVAYQPWATTTIYGYYSPNDNGDLIDLTGTYAEADWAWHNAITNGGNRNHLWRTLTAEEWQYLFASRDNAYNKIGLAVIDSQYNGLIILPDSWTKPTTLMFYPLLTWETNQYTLEEWSQMELAGAIFLPMAGHRFRVWVDYVGELGDYWSSTSSEEDDHACAIHFSFQGLVSQGLGCSCYGLSVRPVTE